VPNRGCEKIDGQWLRPKPQEIVMAGEEHDARPTTAHRAGVKTIEQIATLLKKDVLEVFGDRLTLEFAG
jgi:hypothetical protein